jgi:hypothetical protein
LRWPQCSVGHVDEGLASGGLVECLTEFVESDWQRNQIGCGAVRIVLELGDEFGVAGPVPVTQRFDQRTSDGDEDVRGFGA